MNFINITVDKPPYGKIVLIKSVVEFDGQIGNRFYFGYRVATDINGDHYRLTHCMFEGQSVRDDKMSLGIIEDKVVAWCEMKETKVLTNGSE